MMFFLFQDGDKKAYSESSQWAIKGNKEVISKLRQENKQLRARLSKRMKVSTWALPQCIIFCTLLCTKQ